MPGFVYAQNPKKQTHFYDAFLNDVLNATDWLIVAAIILTIVFICLFILSFFTLIIARINHRLEDNHAKKLKEKYELLLTGIIFNDEDELETEEFLSSKKRVVDHFKQHYLHSKVNRNILREHILLLHKNFAGSSAEILRNLYLELKLDREAAKALNSPDWGLQANAVKELAQLNIPKAMKRIRRCAQNENEVLRLEAQVAMLRLDEVDPFAFLDNPKLYLTEWHQLNLSHVIGLLDKATLPSFSRWFNSKSDTVVQFCVKMTLLFDQFENTDDLILLLKHKNPVVLLEVVKALGEFGATDADVSMLNIYRNTTTEVKIAILNAFGKCGTPDIIPFLQQQLVQNDMDIAFEAGKALKLFGQQGVEVLKQNLTSPLYDVPEICAHLLDDRI